MKQIILNTASVDNSGRRLQSGQSVTVGTGKDAIDGDRAKSLVDRNLASVAPSVSHSKAKAPSEVSETGAGETAGS